MPRISDYYYGGNGITKYVDMDESIKEWLMEDGYIFKMRDDDERTVSSKTSDLRYVLNRCGIFEQSR